MDIRQIEYFNSIVDTGSFRRAAQKHFISQPGLTTAIKKLEQELNAQLFDRSSYRPALTEFGKIFLPHALNILQELSKNSAELSIKRAELDSTINIAIPPLVGSYIFPSMLSAFSTKYPNAIVNIHEANVEQVIELIENNLVDIGMASPQAIALDKFEFINVTRQEIMAALPLGHKFAQKAHISLSELREENFLMIKDSYFPFHIVHTHCKNAGFKPKISIVSSQGSTLKALVAKNMGISFFMEAVLKEAAQVVGIPLNPSIYIDMGLMWRKDKKLSTTTKSFINIFRHPNWKVDK